MKKSILLAAVSLAVISCSKREMEIDPNLPEANEVRFSSGGASVTKVSVDADGHSTFDVDDQIGVYAVLHGKKLGTDGASAFPDNTDFQYLDRKYTVASVKSYDGVTSAAAVASFNPTDVDARMYYLAGGQGWNYYAYFPVLTSTGALTAKMPSKVADATATNFEKKVAPTNGKIGFFDQSKLSEVDAATPYPGPIMFAYYGTEDKAVTAGQTQPAVNLPFKYAVAKLTLEVEVAQAVTSEPETDFRAITLEAAGLKQGIIFDLTKATAVGTTSGVYEVITQDPAAAELDGTWDNSTTVKVPSAATNFRGYLFEAQNVKVGVNSDPSTFTTTGYLIPAGNVAGGDGTLTGAKIKFYVGTTTAPEVYTAELDKDGTNYLKEIAPGKEYKFKIKINKNEVTFTGTIEDWELVDNTTTEIPAE